MMRPFARRFRLRYHVVRNFRLGLVVHIIRLVICTSPIIRRVCFPNSLHNKSLKRNWRQKIIEILSGELNKVYYRRYACKKSEYVLAKNNTLNMNADIDETWPFLPSIQETKVHWRSIKYRWVPRIRSGGKSTFSRQSFLQQQFYQQR